MPRAPVPLNTSHHLDGFDCGKPALYEWLVKRALQAGSSGSARTCVSVDGDDRVVGYFSLTVGQVDATDAPDRIRKGTGQFPIPVIVLARLAVSKQDPGKGIGVGMLKKAIRLALLISEHAGIRALLTHPIDEDAARLYARFGFIRSPLRDDQLMLLLKDARAQIR